MFDAWKIFIISLGTIFKDNTINMVMLLSTNNDCKILESNDTI